MRSVRAANRSGVMSARPTPMPSNWCCGVKYSTAPSEQAEENRAPERQSNGEEIARRFILKQIRGEMFWSQNSHSRMFFWMVGQTFARGSISSKCPAPGKRDQLGISGSLRESLAHVKWNHSVRRAMQHALRHGNGQQLHGRSGRIALGKPIGRSAEKLRPPPRHPTAKRKRAANPKSPPTGTTPRRSTACCAASHNASWPPAECPAAMTRFKSRL